ncbi:unnamed protein product [Clonostachys rosea f. rosea IK726]|uniref:Pisatin demethylase n=2 Tax=Bionectria ochroleuca TaxID=29856 RepID=A0A0B7KBV6_BIOOC|nr:unnamed protein product [Clonostachys rosea f. rosea IK726]
MGILSVLHAHWLALVVVSFGLYIIQTCVVYFRLRKVKGPWLTGISGWPHSLAILSERCHEWYEEANKKYGPIVRVAPNLLVTSSPKVWAHINTHPGYRRSPWFYQACRVGYRQDNVFSCTDEDIHSRKRKQMVAGYSGRENLEMEISIDEQVQELVDLLRSRYLSTQEAIVPVDLAQKVHYFTLDVISSIGQGDTFGLLRTDFDVDDYLKSSHEGMKMFNASLALGFSWLAHAPVIGAFISPRRTDKRGIGIIMDMCFSQVDKRLAEPNDKRSDMLASFIRHGLKGEELRIESVEQFIAGSDTTSAGLRSALLHVITNPRVYKKLQKEANEAVRGGIVPKAGEGIITSNQAKRLPYLQAVVRETLRVWPPVAVLFSRDVPRGGDTVEIESGENVHLPGGVSIGYSAHGMHRNEEIYGTDAKAFRPERWFESDTAKLAVMLRTNDLIFGHGRFQCLGKVVAQMELSKLLFEIVRKFDIALIDPTKPWKARNYMGLFVISDMWVQVMERVEQVEY